MYKMLIINQFGAPSEFSGFRRTEKIASNLKFLGYDVSVICSITRHKKVGKPLPLRNMNKSGVNYFFTHDKPYTRNGFARLINMFQFSFRFRFFNSVIKQEQPDVIICSIQPILSLITSYWYAKKYKKKFVIEVRDLWPESLIDLGIINRNSLIAKVLRQIERRYYNKADLIVPTMSNFELYCTQVLAMKKIPKIVPINNGVDFKEFSDLTLLKPIYDFDKNVFNCLYVGSIGSANYVEFIIQSAKFVQDFYLDQNIKFNIIGDGDCKNYLIKQVKLMQLRNVNFWDRVDNSQIPSILKQADVLLLPIMNNGLYKYGTSQNKLFEYIASGKPIVYTGANHVHNDFIKDYGLGISIEPNNITTFVQSILKIKGYSFEKLKIIESTSTSLAKDEFDFRRLSKKYIDAINSMKGT